MSGTPQLQVLLNTHRDGTKYVAITRGSLLWFKVSLTEIDRLINDLADITEQEHK